MKMYCKGRAEQGLIARVGSRAEGCVCVCVKRGNSSRYEYVEGRAQLSGKF